MNIHWKRGGKNNWQVLSKLMHVHNDLVDLTVCLVTHHRLMAFVSIHRMLPPPTAVAEITKACFISTEDWTLLNLTTWTYSIFYVWITLYLNSKKTIESKLWKIINNKQDQKWALSSSQIIFLNKNFIYSIKVKLKSDKE